MGRTRGGDEEEEEEEEVSDDEEEVVVRRNGRRRGKYSDDDCDGQTDEDFENCVPQAADSGLLQGADAAGSGSASVVERKAVDSSCQSGVAGSPSVPALALMAAAVLGLLMRRRRQRTRI